MQRVLLEPVVRGSEGTRVLPVVHVSSPDDVEDDSACCLQGTSMLVLGVSTPVTAVNTRASMPSTSQRKPMCTHASSHVRAHVHTHTHAHTHMQSASQLTASNRGGGMQMSRLYTLQVLMRISSGPAIRCDSGAVGSSGRS